MTNINPYSTPVAKGQITGQTPVTGGGTGMNFWDFLLGGANGTPGATTLQSSVQNASLFSLTTQAKITPDATMTPVPGEADIILDALEGGDADALAELALFLDGAEGAKGIDTADLRVERVQKRLDTLNKLVNHLTNGMPAAQKNDAAIETLVARLDQHIEKLESHIRDLQSGKIVGDDANISLLIAMGLTPAQLTKMSERIEEVEKKLGRELTVEDLIAGVANIVPPPQDQNKLLLSTNATVKLNGNIDPAADIPADAEPTDDLAAQLNGLVVGVGNNGDDLLTAADADGAADKPVMRGLDLLQKLMTGAKDAAAQGGAKAGDIIKSGFSSLLNLTGMDGDIALPASWYNTTSGSVDFSSFDIQAGLPLTTAAHAAHLTTSVQQAGHAHPATQLVSAHLTKAAQDGGPKTMTIELDPPELGRVDVRLEFGADNKVKAHLVVEKAETLGLLQRDAAYLDRALTNAGLDTSNGTSLSFELAHDRAFDRGQDGGNGHGGNGNGKQAEADDNIIQSTMTWQVDPDTGHVRYNILA